jgi:mannose-1-phosphate guanylyltransferase
MDPQLYVLIIAGGRGTRFWPRSRRAMPKQCISLDGPLTLIQQTVQRVLPMVPPERILVVTSADMALALFEQLPELPDGNILVEPVGMNTAPAVGWGAMEIAKRARGQNPVMCVLPSDHLIADEEELRGTLLAAAKAARATNALVTIGLEPTAPETGYGYLHCGEEQGRWGDRAFARVERFVEKPDAETARRYIVDGHFLWNAGMFVFTVDAIRDNFRQYLPNTWAQLERLRHSPSRLEELYPLLDAISIDYGIMERASHVLTVRVELGWSDVGSWTALKDHLPAIEGGVGVAKHSVALNARDNIVHAPGKLVALMGVEGLVVVDTGDVLLVCRAEDAQGVRELAGRVAEQGLDDYL